MNSKAKKLIAREGLIILAFVALALGTIFICPPVSALEPGDYDFSLRHGGSKRTYKLHLPPTYQKTAPMPLVLAFHGGGGNSKIMASDKFYQLKNKADKEGFIVAFPNGTSRLRSGRFATWNTGNCCGYARDRQIDDVGFVRKVVEDIESKLSIDHQKIFAMGMSNGGMFSYRLACEMADTFKAVASVAGTDNDDDCRPAKPISIFHIHAKDDGHVLFGGGAGKDAFWDESSVTDFTSVPETISRWTGRNRCGSTPERILDKEGAYCDRYSCANHVSVQLCVTETGAHSWPGGKKPRLTADKPSKALSATDEIWDFFTKQHF